jgi:tetratricopeptide (TPR) repeat protein
VDTAAALFSPPSLFARPCAHEISAIRKEMRDGLNSNQPERARNAALRLLSHVHNDLDTTVWLVALHARMNQRDTALSDGLELLERTDLDAAQRMTLHNVVGDLLALEGALDQAREHYQAVLSASVDPSSRRLALIKIESLARGQTGASVRDFLDTGTNDAARLLDLHAAALDAHTWAGAWYLLGRQLFLREHFTQAIPYLQRAGELGFRHPALCLENLRLLAIARYRTGDRADAALILTVLSMFPNGAGDDPNVHDWLERIRFDER